MDDKRTLLRHFLAALAYRTQKALRGAPLEFGGAPVPPENFIVAEIDPDRLGPDQADAVGPDAVWPEAPVGWLPRSSKMRE